jgi:hypothetical protein
VVNRSTASVVGLFAFLPEGATQALTTFVLALKTHSDFSSFLIFVAIYMTVASAIGLGVRAYAHWRHGVSDSAMRALPVFLVGIDDAGA